MLRLDERSLISTRKKGRPPETRAECRHARWAKREVARKVLVLRAEPIRDPRPPARPCHDVVSTIEKLNRRLVVGNVTVHRPHDADVVNQGARFLKEGTHGNAALTVPPKLERRTHDSASLPLGRKTEIPGGLSVETIEKWLGIKRINLGRASLQKEVDDLLRFRREVRWLRRQRIDVRCGRLRSSQSTSKHPLF